MCVHVHICTRVCMWAHECLLIFHSRLLSLPTVSTLTGFSCLLVNHGLCLRASTYLPANYSQHFLFRCLQWQHHSLSWQRSFEWVSGSKHKHVRGSWSTWQSIDVSVAQKRVKKFVRGVSACHVGLRLHVGQHDWRKHGICVWLWQLIWIFVLFSSSTICTVIKTGRNRQRAVSCQTFASIV